ncbi:DUF3854 domain-containing protein [Mycobacterium sp. M1]|uniref:DUF3854 domain-containing protein n=1 Tax=Mycolicibacter acidiphilus TaxID=2835306 RepID=A0ABS5RLC1_9MYCO|nr:DNA primase family protein [Mycolicibacter acidiphilus]MBS9535090.1 DUF3854 domain-containing protein [Mycolicibacter acidiphilus]
MSLTRIGDGEEFDPYADVPPPTVPPYDAAEPEDIYGGSVSEVADDAESPEDPDLTAELPGVELTPAHLTYLLDGGFTEDYLDLPHVAPLIRSFNSWEHIPEARRFAIDHTHEPTGIWFGHRDPKTDKISWQLRPDHPTVGDDGRPKKYTFRKGSGSPVGLVSAPLAVPPVNHTVLIIEGTKQARAVAAALAHDPSYVVVCIPGCQNGVTNGRLQDGISHVAKGAKQVIIVPDADAATNTYVYDAMDRLGKAIRARMNGRRNCVRFAQLVGAKGLTDGIDDVLAELPALERPAYLTELIDNAIPAPADVRPKKRPRGEDADEPMYFHPFAGGLRTKACAEAILDAANYAIDSESGVLYRWSVLTGLYEPDRNAGSQRGSAFVSDNLCDLLGDDYRSTFISSVEEMVRARLIADGRIIPEVPDTNGSLPVNNGLLDMETGRLVPYSPEVFVTAKLNVDFDPDAECLEFDAWLPEATSLSDGTNQAAIVLDAMSALLDTASGRRAPDIAPYLYGAPRAGKGTLGNDIIGTLIPPQFQTAMSLSEMAADRPVQNASLYRMLVNISGETRDEFVADTSVMKRVLGGDLITAELKYGKLWRFRNRAFCIFMGNDLPHVSDTTGGFTARLVPIRFTKSNVGQEDRGIGMRLRAELPGILNRLIEAWKARQSRGGTFLPPAAEATRAFAEATNPVSEFMSERVGVAPEAAWSGTGTVTTEWGTTKTDLYAEYTAHALSVGRKPMARKRFLDAITRAPFNVREGRTSDGRRVFGCKLLPVEESHVIGGTNGTLTIPPPTPPTGGGTLPFSAMLKAAAHNESAEAEAEGDDDDKDDNGGGSPITPDPTPTVPPTATSESIVNPFAVLAHTTPEAASATPTDATPTGSNGGSGRDHPALARMSVEFWRIVDERGVVVPKPTLTLASDNQFAEWGARQQYSGAVRRLSPVVTLAELAASLHLPPEMARAYLRAANPILKDCGVTLLERRLTTDGDLTSVDSYTGTFIKKTDKNAVSAQVGRAKRELTQLKRDKGVEPAAVRAAEQRYAALSEHLSEMKKVSEYLPVERQAFVIVRNPEFAATKEN